MNRFRQIAAKLRVLAYEHKYVHDPDLLKNHEQRVKDKLKVYDSETGTHTPDAMELYNKQKAEHIYKPVSPDDVFDILHSIDDKSEIKEDERL
jgi:hypothetical protein